MYLITRAGGTEDFRLVEMFLNSKFTQYEQGVGFSSLNLLAILCTWSSHIIQAGKLRVADFHHMEPHGTDLTMDVE